MWSGCCVITTASTCCGVYLPSTLCLRAWVLRPALRSRCALRLAPYESVIMIAEWARASSIFFVSPSLWTNNLGVGPIR